MASLVSRGANGRSMSKLEPRYQSVVTSIREKVRNGEMQEGDSIPSRKDLASHFKTTKATVDRAIRELMQEGYLEARAGSGTYVRRSRGHTGNRVACLVSSAPMWVVDVSNNYFGP